MLVNNNLKRANKGTGAQGKQKHAAMGCHMSMDVTTTAARRRRRRRHHQMQQDRGPRASVTQVRTATCIATAAAHAPHKLPPPSCVTQAARACPLLHGSSSSNCTVSPAEKQWDTHDALACVLFLICFLSCRGSHRPAPSPPVLMVTVCPLRCSSSRCSSSKCSSSKCICYSSTPCSNSKPRLSRCRHSSN